MDLKDQITHIFVQIDDFSKEFDAQKKTEAKNIRQQQEKKKQNLKNV